MKLPGILLGIAAIVSGTHARAFQSTTRQVFDLDKIVNSDDGSAMKLRCIMQFKATKRFDFDDYNASEIELVVDRVRRADNLRVFQLKLDRQLETKMSSSAPLWDKGFVDQDFILPSAKFIRRNGEIFIVAFSGECFEAFKFSDSSDRFEPVDVTSKTVREVRLRASRMFDSSDIYWTYGIVRFGESLGGHNSPIDFSHLVDANYLWKEWNRPADNE